LEENKVGSSLFTNGDFKQQNTTHTNQAILTCTENMTMGNEVYKVAPQNGSARFLFECFNNYYAYSPIFGPQF